jgi:hypothetical protein
MSRRPVISLLENAMAPGPPGKVSAEGPSFPFP